MGVCTSNVNEAIKRKNATMRCLIFALAICLSIASTVYSQKTERNERNSFVQIPREIVLPVIVFQPSSPLQFEKVERLLKMDGGGANIYQLRNRSLKPIRRFAVSYLLGEGTGGSWEWEGSSGEVIMPSQLAPSPVGDESMRFIPLTEELREKLELNGRMKTVVFYMVERVEFTDGSTFIDELAAKALKSYLDDISDKLYRSTDSSAEKVHSNKKHRR